MVTLSFLGVLTLASNLEPQWGSQGFHPPPPHLPLGNQTVGCPNVMTQDKRFSSWTRIELSSVQPCKQPGPVISVSYPLWVQSDHKYTSSP